MGQNSLAMPKLVWNGYNRTSQLSTLVEKALEHMVVGASSEKNRESRAEVIMIPLECRIALSMLVSGTGC